MSDKTKGSVTRYVTEEDTRFGPYTKEHEGLTIRDHFAGLAMQAMVSNPQYNDWNWATISDEAYSLADHMLAQRSKP